MANAEPMTEEQAREQVRREVDIQRRALTLVEQLETGPALAQTEIAIVCEALRIFARDQHESFALAELAMRRLKEYDEAGKRRKCGWCVLALGDALAESYPDNESCQAHVHGCEHNPLVVYVNNLSAELEHAKRELARRDVEVAKLRTDAERMRPVFDAALAYCHAPSGCWQSEARLVEAAGLAAAAIAIEAKESGRG